jgi:uncharacterized protein
MKAEEVSIMDDLKRQEERLHETHLPPPETVPGFESMAAQIYGLHDDSMLQHMEPISPHYKTIKSLDELLERDEQREKDGFKRKINVGKVVKPAGGGRNKIVIVPTTMEEKFYHDNRISEEDREGDRGEEGDIDQTTGTSEGEEGDVIGEIPLKPEGEGEGTGAGQGDGDSHDIGSTAYELGKMLTEKFKLPNLQDKGKKKSLTRFVYDLTDRNRGSGQILDKKRTLNQILKTNIGLGQIAYGEEFKLEDLLINPRDYVYQIMSREQDTESQAIVFFVRDYSGSMQGRPTEIVCSQHVMIYSWLMYQYRQQVETRFILHDTDAKEVDDFHTYYNMQVAGGTKIRSAIQRVNEIIEQENLAKEYNIYVFYGGDGDDWNSDAEGFAGAIRKLYGVASRVGFTIVQAAYRREPTVFEKFLRSQDLVGETFKKEARLDVIGEDEANDKRLIEGIMELVS